MPIARALVIAVLCVLTAVSLADAQVSELPVPFDSAARVRTLTPQLVARLGLVAPAWPVDGEFIEARLFATSLGSHVLAVDRSSGATDRYAISDSALVALRAAVNDALARVGTVVTEAQPQVISGPARGAFVRNQMMLAFGLYGPLLATMTDDAKTGTAMYLFATSASYFITTGISRSSPVTRAQNHLATDGALRGWGSAAGLLMAVQGDGNRKTYSGVGLAGALAGSALGYQFGKRLTDSEAQAATTFSTFSALTTLGISGATGLAQRSDDGRPVVGAMVGAGVLGYALGPLYPRTARYTVTRGDVQMLSIGALLGASTGFAPFANEGASTEAAAAAATAGFLLGIVTADRLGAMPFDYSTSDAAQVGLGLVAGGLMGGAASVLVDASLPVGWGLVTAGGILGAVAGHKFARPARASSGATRVGAINGRRNIGLDVHPAALVLGASRVPGRHALFSVRF